MDYTLEYLQELSDKRIKLYKEKAENDKEILAVCKQIKPSINAMYETFDVLKFEIRRLQGLKRYPTISCHDIIPHPYYSTQYEGWSVEDMILKGNKSNIRLLFDKGDWLLIFNEESDCDADSTMYIVTDWGGY